MDQSTQTVGAAGRIRKRSKKDEVREEISRLWEDLIFLVKLRFFHCSSSAIPVRKTLSPMWHLLRTHYPMGNLLNAHTFNKTILARRLSVRELKRVHYKRIERRKPDEFKRREWKSILLEIFTVEELEAAGQPEHL